MHSSLSTPGYAAPVQHLQFLQDGIHVLVAFLLLQALCSLLLRLFLPLQHTYVHP